MSLDVNKDMDNCIRGGCTFSILIVDKFLSLPLPLVELFSYSFLDSYCMGTAGRKGVQI